jgi:signal transduction histidine kinase
MFRRNSIEMRAVILAPVGRDAQLLAATLTSSRLETLSTPDADSLLARLEEGAGVVIIAQEALSPKLLQALTDWLASQPPWSDMPVLILTYGGRPTPESTRQAHDLETLGNVTLMERPVRPETVQSAVRAALRARSRQYEMRRRQEELIRANADLEQFAYSASHDLREPIRSIAVYSELLAKHYDGVLDPRGREFLRLIRAGAERMEALLADLLSYAQASNIPDELPEPVPAGEPLEAALENLSGAICESGAEITFGELPAVRMRPAHLEQLFQNLVGNAIKYRTEEPPQVQLLARRENGHWLFSVADNGIGIAPEYRESIFGIFKRLHTAQSYSGTGMGLAICQRIVERYRGRIWVESELGHGSSFHFTIPG